MLKRSYDNEADIPEEHKGFYTEKDGKWVLDVEGGGETPNNRQVLADLARERKKRQDLEKEVNAYKAAGKTPEEIAELLAAAEERGEKDAESKGEWDKLKAQMVEKHNAELAKRDKIINDLKGTVAAKEKAIETLLVETSATAAIAEHEGEGDLLMPFVRNHIKVVDDEGKPILQIVDAKGDPRVNAKGEPMTVSELVADMRQNEKYGRLFKGAGTSGSGTPPRNGGGGGGNSPKHTRKADLKTEREKADFVDQYGPEAYKALT